MAELYAIDTNLYIHAVRDPQARLALTQFLLRVGPRIRLHAVVAMELRAGARTAAQHAELAALVAPYVQRGRVVVPTLQAYEQAGRVLAELAAKERFDARVAPPSFASDVLLATSCREAGVTLVTANHGDFARIKRHLRGFRAAPPWPRV